MLSKIGSVLPFGRGRLTVVVAAFLAATCLAVASDDPKEKKGLPEGVTEVTKDDLLNKIPNFFSFEYGAEPQASKRLWLRVDSKTWLERYPDGKETRFQILGRAKAQGIQGTILDRIDGESGKTDGFQVFVPDKSDEATNMMFRNPEQGGDWAEIGEMESVE
jgi:hypothetical protein